MRIVSALALLMAVALPARGLAQPACPFGEGALPVDTLPPGTLHGSQIPFEHVVVLMQENRSYDHYFGKLRKKSGPPHGTSNPDPLGGDPIKPFHQPRYCETSDLEHGWNSSHLEFNGGAMDGFTTENIDPTDPSGRRAMGYYTRRDLPFYFKLYKKFASGDRFFCSVLGPTYPNRYYLLAATSFGHVNNAFPNFAAGEWTQRTIFNVLDEAVPPISWKIYASDLAAGLLFGYVRDQYATHGVPVSQFAADAAAGTLPQVSFVDPSFFGEGQNDEHPPTNIQLGQAFVASIVSAVMTSPLWPSTVLFITYDEHGGYFDHVPPPPACLPDAIAPTPTPAEPGAFDNYGIRVPFVAVSPYSKKNFVSHNVYDHTSILRFIETRFDLPALTGRDANADPLLDMFDFSRQTFAKPPSLPAAVISSDHPECQ